jgi:hypothetical protein
MYVGYQGPAYIYPMRPGADIFLRRLVQQGWTIVIMTSANLINVIQFLENNNLQQYVDKVTDKKVPALVYLDDRGIRFEGDFEAAYNIINNFKTFWEMPEHQEGGKV